MKNLWGIIAIFCFIPSLNGMHQTFNRQIRAVAPSVYRALAGHATLAQPTFMSTLRQPMVLKLAGYQNLYALYGTRPLSTFNWKDFWNSSRTNNDDQTTDKSTESAITENPFNIALKNRCFVNFEKLLPKVVINSLSPRIADIFTRMFGEAYKKNDLKMMTTLLECVSCSTGRIRYSCNDIFEDFLAFPEDKELAILNYAYCAVQNQNHPVVKLFVDSKHKLLECWDGRKLENLVTLFAISLANQDLKTIKILLASTTDDHLHFAYTGGMSGEQALCKLLDNPKTLGDKQLRPEFVSALYEEIAHYVKPETALKMRCYRPFAHNPASSTAPRLSESEKAAQAKKASTNAARFKSNDPFIIFGIPYGTYTRAQISHIFRELASEFHPDNGGDTEAMQKINQAKSELLARCKA